MTPLQPPALTAFLGHREGPGTAPPGVVQGTSCQTAPASLLSLVMFALVSVQWTPSFYQVIDFASHHFTNFYSVLPYRGLITEGIKMPVTVSVPVKGWPASGTCSTSPRRGSRDAFEMQT